MKDLEKYLRENAPATPDEGQFLIETNARLDSVEGIKKTVDGEHRRWRAAVIAALVAGMVLGCVITALVLLYPLPPVQVEEPFLAKAVRTLHQWLPALAGFAASCALALLIVSRTSRREA